jgi:hypothetical protein
MVMKNLIFSGKKRRIVRLNQQTFWRNMSPPFSVLKNNPSKKQAIIRQQTELYSLPDLCWILAWIIIRPWGYSWYVCPKYRLTFKDYTALYLRIYETSEIAWVSYPENLWNLSLKHKDLSISAAHREYFVVVRATTVCFSTRKYKRRVKQTH